MRRGRDFIEERCGESARGWLGKTKVLGGGGEINKLFL